MNDRVLIAGTHSGCGKTTVTCALLSALKSRGVSIAAFKCGPDYIDPMFHREAQCVPARNLDPFFCTKEQLCFELSEAGGSLSVIEGVMGYYDGIGAEGRASTYDVARETETPVILTVNVRGMYTSAGALIAGFRAFREHSGVQGVIFNGASPMLYGGLKGIAKEAGVTSLGFLPFDAALSVGSRNLGLVTAEEITDLKARLAALGALAEKHIDLDGVMGLASRAPALQPARAKPERIADVRIAVARDRAFCFLYRENLELLEALGAELCFFSPLSDTTLPEGIHGLYLPGGYPELYLKALSENRPMLGAVKSAVLGGLPTLAECGGFMYLNDDIDGIPMAGAIRASACRTEKLQRFGYVTLTAGRDTLLCRAGESIRAHEFHYYDSTDCGNAFSAEKPGSGRRYACIHGTETLFAGFPHLYFPANPGFAESFIRKAAAYCGI